MKKLILLTVILSFILSTRSYSCTIVMVSDSKVCLAGSNEDSVFPLTILWYIPATENNYARVCLGYKMVINSTQGGMNEKGLFVDGNSLGKQDWKHDNNKKALFGSLLDRLLATCASVEEVKEFFKTYNIPDLDRARIPVMDKTGASMIVEWYNGEVVFLETDKKYQVATNFVESKYIGKDKPCWRYNRAIEFLETKDSFSTDIVSDALDKTHLDHNTSTTVYSFICDLKNGDIYIFNYHDYSKSLKFNLNEELENGQNGYYVNNLFADRKTDYEKFIEDGPVKMIERGYRNNKIAALMFYNILKTHYPQAFNKNISINTLSQFGKNLVEKGKFEDGITFLERNILEFPDSARSHFELANLYLKTNNKEKAIEEYKKTLDINPDHLKARQELEKLLNQK